MRNPTLVLAFPLSRNRPFQLEPRASKLERLNSKSCQFYSITYKHSSISVGNVYKAINNKQRDGVLQ